MVANDWVLTMASFQLPIALVGVVLVVLGALAPRGRRGLVVIAGVLVFLDAVLGASWVVALNTETLPYGSGLYQPLATLRSLGGTLLLCAALVLLMLAAAKRTADRAPSVTGPAPGHPPGVPGWQQAPPQQPGRW